MTAPLSDYEVQRLRNIEHNEKRLAELQIVSVAGTKRTISAEEKYARACNRQQRLHLGKQRTSLRIAKNAQKCEEGGGNTSEDSFRPCAGDSEFVFENNPKLRPKRSRKFKPEEQPLTKEQRESLSNAAGWIEDMQRWFQGKLSDANLRSVMRVVRALASGAGVPHTKRSDWFLKETPIALTDDFQELRRRASEWLTPEDDPGHGWRLDHPLGKLALYQRHLAEEKARMAADEKVQPVEPCGLQALPTSLTAGSSLSEADAM